MSTAFSIVFLLVFFGIPLIMVVMLVWMGMRHVRDKRARAAAVQSGKWVEVDPTQGDLQAILTDLHLTHGKFKQAWQTPDASTTVVIWSKAGVTRSRETSVNPRQLMILRARPRPGPRGVAARKAGGMLEAAAIGASLRWGHDTMEPPGWDWSRVMAPDGTFLAPELGQAVAPHVDIGSTLHLGTTHLALSFQPGPVGPLLDTATERLQALQAALGG